MNFIFRFTYLCRYQESGIIKHWFNELYLKVHWMDTLFETQEKLPTGTRILNLIDVSGGFLVLLFGLCAASIAFVGEFTINNLKQLNRRVDVEF